MTSPSTHPLISIVVPFYNEEACVSTVLDEILSYQPLAEIIAVDDGSTDKTWSKIRSNSKIRGLRLTENRGQSGALYAGLHAARGSICVMLDGDGQNDPADIQSLIDLLQDKAVDVVCGYRKTRKDTTSRRIASRLANFIRRQFLHDGIRDTGCSLKAFRREAVQYLVPFNGLHRYLPAIFLKANLTICEVPVNHRPREAGVSKYTNWDRGLRGIYDLIGVAWLLRRKVHLPKIEDTHNG